jgi:hypothetical protein
MLPLRVSAARQSCDWYSPMSGAVALDDEVIPVSDLRFPAGWFPAGSIASMWGTHRVWW